MSVYDRWHKTFPQLDHPDPEKNDKPCRCSNAKRLLYPTADHPRPAADGKPAKNGGLRWQVRYTDLDGKSCKKNFRLKDGKNPDLHAEAYDAKTKADLDARRYVDPTAGDITLQAFAEKWRARLIRDPSSLDIVDDQLGHIIKMPEPGHRPSRRFGDTPSPIADISMFLLSREPGRIQDWVLWLQAKKLSARYIHEIAMTLSSVFIAALDNEIVTRNPVRAKSVTIPPAEQSLALAWAPTQVIAARTFLERVHPREALIVDLGTGGGLRQGEILGFAEEDVDAFGDRQMKVRRQIKMKDGVMFFALPKGGKERTVPLSDYLAGRLFSHTMEFPSVPVTLPWGSPDGELVTFNLLIVRADGSAWDRANLNNKVWRPTRAAVGVPKGREHGMHVLRHTFASICLAGTPTIPGEDIVKLAAWMGHTDPSFTLRTYTHMTGGESKTRNIFDAYFLSASALELPSGGLE